MSLQTIEIKLSNTNDVGLIDIEDLSIVSFVTWHKDAQGYISAYKKIPKTRKNEGFKLHRVVLGLKKGDGKIVDHINRNKLDCRKCNLRLVTDAQNCVNQGLRRDSKSGFKGVSPHSNYKSKPWVASIQKDRVWVYLGCYSTKEDAAKAYDAKAKELFGEFAAVNFP